MARGMHLAAATNLLIRRHAYAKDCFSELGADTDESTDVYESALEADSDAYESALEADTDAYESELETDTDAYESALETDTDESTDDGSVLEVLEPYQLVRCRCPQPTWRMALVPGETEYRCFECLRPHPDQSRDYAFRVSPHRSDS